MQVFVYDHYQGILVQVASEEKALEVQESLDNWIFFFAEVTPVTV